MAFSRASLPEAPPSIDPGASDQTRQWPYEVRRQQRQRDEEQRTAGGEREQPLAGLGEGAEQADPDHGQGGREQQPGDERAQVGEAASR